MGDSYALRNSDFDITRYIGKAINLSTTLNGGEVSFSKGIGAPNSIGIITVTDSNGNDKKIDINEDGIVREE